MKITTNGRESWRTDRVNRAVKIAGIIADLTIEQLEILILEIVEGQGCLFITWEYLPTDTQKRAFFNAWEMCKEQGANVFHYQHSRDEV